MLFMNGERVFVEFDVPEIHFVVVMYFTIQRLVVSKVAGDFLVVYTHFFLRATNAGTLLKPYSTLLYVELNLTRLRLLIYFSNSFINQFFFGICLAKIKCACQIFY
jgi:hypothetical protein